MDKRLPEFINHIFAKFTDKGHQLFLVGGAVRDLILDRPIINWDFTTDAKPDQIMELFPDAFYNNSFGTVSIPLNQGTGDNERGAPLRTETRDNEEESQMGLRVGRTRSPETILEITTMRKEGVYEDSRHPVEVSWTNKIDQDLARRDFTINAMALDKDLQLTDPYQGQEDIKQGIIRAVGDPNLRFLEDALRLMRAIRIATELEFEIESNTLAAITSNAQRLVKVAPERIKTELWKLLASTNPYMGVMKLKESGLLQVILPELDQSFGIVQEGPKHDRIYDIGEHSFLTLKNTPSQDPLVRLAALLHDIGKVDTYKIDESGNVTFFNHEVVGGYLVQQIARRLNLSKKDSDKLYRLVRWHMFSVDEHQTDSAVRRFIKNVGLENIDDMMALRVGDRIGGGTQKAVSWRMEEFRQRIDQVMQKPFSITDLKVNGRDVMEVLKIKPSRQVGEILDQLFQEVLADDSKNNREYLLDRITKLKVI